MAGWSWSNCFIKKNGQHTCRYRYLVLGRDRSYFVPKKKKKLKNTLILPKSSLKLISSTGSTFLIDNIFVMFGGRVFQQTVGIPMGTNRAPLLADLFRYSYEADFTQGLLKKNEMKLV